jgi:hypothetical protein
MVRTKPGRSVRWVCVVAAAVSLSLVAAGCSRKVESEGTGKTASRQATQKTPTPSGVKGLYWSGAYRVGPYRQCVWDYENGLEPFKNSSTDPNFDSTFNPQITVSRRGLTARVVGVLADATMVRFGGSLERVIEAYPYLKPVAYTAVHRVKPEDVSKSEKARLQDPGGEVLETQVLSMPANSVMIIYPVSIAAAGYNTAAGNWTVQLKQRAKPTNALGAFGNFPFLLYTTAGHALHGPITGDRTADLWGLRRGKVSHGCNRMEGEHVIELSVLLGCSARGDQGRCTAANESVVVMEEFDHFPDPAIPVHQTGIIADFAEIYRSWVIPDVQGYPRETASRLPLSLSLGENVLKLEQSRSKAWSQVPDELGSRTQFRIDEGAARVREFRSWDDRVTSRSVDKRPHIGARSCRG